MTDHAKCPLCSGPLDVLDLVILPGRGLVVGNSKATTLTAKEMEVLRTLVDASPAVVRKESLLRALYLNPNDEAEIKIVDVFICKLRSKIKGLGFTIETAWGTGYYIDRNAGVRVVDDVEPDPDFEDEFEDSE